MLAFIIIRLSQLKPVPWYIISVVNHKSYPTTEGTPQSISPAVHFEDPDAPALQMLPEFMTMISNPGAPQ